jgi:hypothetical protein
MQDSPAITASRPLATPRPLAAPRARRRAAAVIAQYIQDLSRPSEPVPCTA